jgi:N-acetylglutamate synthase-like GNAT family acetyltransferase
MKEIIIREANEADSAAISRLLGQLGYPAKESEALDKILSYKKTSYKLLVAEKEDEVIGYIALHYYDTLHWKKPLGRINSFCVDEKYRGTGVGKELIKAAEKYFKEIDCQKIEVSSNKRRTDTQRFYLNRGYQEYSRIFAKLEFS